jgi:hypothetical protein
MNNGSGRAEHAILTDWDTAGHAGQGAWSDLAVELTGSARSLQRQIMDKRDDQRFLFPRRQPPLLIGEICRKAG